MSFIYIQKNRLHVNIFEYLQYNDLVNLKTTNTIKISDSLPNIINDRFEEELSDLLWAYEWNQEMEYQKNHTYDCVCGKNYDGGPFCTFCRDIAIC